MVPVKGAVLEKGAGPEAKLGADGEAKRAEAGCRSADRVAMSEHDAVAGANDGLWIDLIGEADAWAEVLVVVVDRSGAVAGVGAVSGELQRAIDSGDGIGEVGIEEASGVVDFRQRREEVIAKTEIEGQLRSDSSSCPARRARWRGSECRTPAGGSW